MARAQRTADFGSLRTDIASVTAKCKSPDSFVTRLDIQTNQAAGWDAPYVSGLRLYCNDNSPPQPLNWNKPSNGTAYIGIDGKVANDGIKDLMVSHKTYINLVGYGTQTMLGNFKDVNLWQQAAQKEYNSCLLVGIECAYVAWLDGYRAHFSCPPAESKPEVAGAMDRSAGAIAGGFSICAFAGGGIGAGLVVAAAMFGLLVVLRRRQFRAQQHGHKLESPVMQLQQPIPPVAVDPYKAAFNIANQRLASPQPYVPER